MARTDTLTNYLTDVATAIKTKTGDSTAIPANQFDTEINSILDKDDYFASGQYISGSRTVKTSNGYNSWPGAKMLKRLPKISLIASGSYSCGYVFSLSPNLEEANINGLDFTTASGVTYFKGMFYGCPKLKKVDMGELELANPNTLSNMFKNCSVLESVNMKSITGTTDVGELFIGCTSLNFIDMRGLDISNCSYVTTSSNGPFLGDATATPATNVPYDCKIIVADQTQKNFMATNFPNYTNVKTVAEYEAE